ncbi:MAG: hypothetical protein MZW92_31435 [Comamonadaceae bacterium]|nr:hypothetical protein [Comamonadaceae bacterium]
MKRIQAAVEDTVYDPDDGLVGYTYYDPKRAVYHEEFLHPGVPPDKATPITIYNTPEGEAAAAPSEGGTPTVQTFNNYTLQWASSQNAGLASSEKACAVLKPTGGAEDPSHATGDIHLTSSMPFSSDRIAVKFRIQLPEKPMVVGTGSPDPIVLFQFGSGAAGTIRISYLPRIGDARFPHAIYAEVLGTNGSAVITVTTHPQHSDIMIPVYFEYDGNEAVIFCDRSSDHIMSSTGVALVNGTTVPITFGADYYILKENSRWADNPPDKDQVLYFDNLEIYNTTLITPQSLEDPQFPYFTWDEVDNGVIAVLPTPAPLATQYSFVDTGFAASHRSVQFDLTSTEEVVGATLYVNEKAISIAPDAGTGAEVVTWLASLPGGELPITIDGASESLFFSGSGTELTVDSENGEASYSIRFVGGTGGDWGLTKPVVGKIPHQYQYPKTGEVNYGVSVLGTTASTSHPEVLTVKLPGQWSYDPRRSDWKYRQSPR